MKVQSNETFNDFKFRDIMNKIESLENVKNFVVVDFYPLDGPVHDVYTITVCDFKNFLHRFFNEGMEIDLALCDFIENIENRYITTRMEDIVCYLKSKDCKQIKTYEKFKYMMSDYIFLSNFGLYALAEKE